jgi:hypothetical protein
MAQYSARSNQSYIWEKNHCEMPGAFPGEPWKLKQMYRSIYLNGFRFTSSKAMSRDKVWTDCLFREEGKFLERPPIP